MSPLEGIDRVIREVPMGCGHIINLRDARDAMTQLFAEGWNMVATARHTGQPIDPERLAAALAACGAKP